MPCIYADFTQEPLLARVFTSRTNKAHPALNSVTWILLQRKKQVALACSSSELWLVQALELQAACFLEHIAWLYQSYKCRRTHVMLFVYFTAWELSTVLVAPLSSQSALSWVFLCFCLTFGFLSTGARNRKHPSSSDGRMHFFTQQITVELIVAWVIVEVKHLNAFKRSQRRCSLGATKCNNLMSPCLRGPCIYTPLEVYTRNNLLTCAVVCSSEHLLLVIERDKMMGLDQSLMCTSMSLPMA